MFINYSKLPQILDIPNKAFPATIYPGSVFDETIYKTYFPPEYFREFQLSDLTSYKNLTLIRAYAMGDIIQLVPVARYLRNKFNYKDVYIATHSDFKPLGFLFKDIKFTTENMISGDSFDYGLKINLDGRLEKDHSTSNTENAVHRIEIYLNTFGIKNVKKEDLDWSSNMKSVTMPFSMLKNARKLIGIQMRGSGEVKTLPVDYTRKLISELSKEYTVVLLDHNKDYGFEGQNIINLCGKLSPIQCVSLLSNLSACITMDSGMLWMAHIANCPVVTLLGPTRVHERLSLHPSYPEKVKGIQITELIGCKPCFETRAYCGGRIKCMKDFPQDALTKVILENVKSII